MDVPLAPVFRRAYQTLGACVLIYGLALLALTNNWLFRNVLYAHQVSLNWGIDINKPEQFGFAKNQVTPFSLSTPDGEILYAWHILPLGLYARHEEEILQRESGHVEDIYSTVGFRLLSEDPEARLIINFHGNAGTVAQGWRTDTYRTLSSGSTSNLHILTIDYRGFGFSTGFPNETGLIVDGIAAVNWAIEFAKIPPGRIALVGQSLGTAVTAAVAEHFANEGTEFAGIVMIASFTDVPNLLNGYKIGGWIPALSPLGHYPWLLKWFQSQIEDTWDTASRLANFIRKSNRVRLTLIHALDDYEIPWHNTETLFTVATNASILGTVSPFHEATSLQRLNEMKKTRTIDNGDGAFVSTWNLDDGKKIIREQILAYGHHSRVMTYAPVALAVMRAFGFEEKLPRGAVGQLYTDCTETGCYRCEPAECEEIPSYTD